MKEIRNLSTLKGDESQTDGIGGAGWSENVLKRLRNWTMLFFVVAALSLIIVTWTQVQEYFNTGGDVTIWLLAALLADFVLSFTIVVFIGYQLMRKREKARRSDQVASPLYLRLLRHFSFMALIPAIVTAVIGTAIIFVLGDRIFSEIRVPMDNATRAAVSYIDNQYQQQNIAMGALSQKVANEIGNLSIVNAGELRQTLQRLPETSPFDHTFIVNPLGNVVARGRDSYVFDCDTVSSLAIRYLGIENADVARGDLGIPCQTTQDIGEPEAFRCYRNERGGDCPDIKDDIADANTGISTVVFRRQGSDKLYALARLEDTEERFVYGQKQINEEILQLYIASQTNSSDKIINRLALQVLIGSIIYVLLLAVLLSLMLQVSNRIAKQVSRPVEKLASLANRVKGDDREVTIPVFGGDDEIARLGRSFKEMVERLVERQDQLALKYSQEEEERRKFDSVLETVSAGVIGVAANGDVTFYNKAARKILDVEFESNGKMKHLSDISPDLHATWADLVDDIHKGHEGHEKILFARRESHIELLVRAAEWHGHQGHEMGSKQFVLSIEDVTKLTESERAKFAVEAAKQVAHDLKSPLQAAKFAMSNLDILLSEEARHKIQKQYQAIDSNLDRVADLVNRFRIPGVLGEIVLEEHDIYEVFVQFVGETRQRRPHLNLKLNCETNDKMKVRIDKRSLRDVFENLIKNAIDSIEAFEEKPKSNGSEVKCQEIRIQIQPSTQNTVLISISDNGAGLAKGKIDFTAVGVSTRGAGRGRGLTIVEAMVKKHRGKFHLQDAPIFDGNDHAGAQAVIELPLCEA